MRGFCVLLVLLAITAKSTQQVPPSVVVAKCDPTDQFECLGSDVSCVGNTCMCDPGYHGKRFLGCHLLQCAICQVFNDPSGKTFGREPIGGIDIPLPCPYLAAKVCVQGHLLQSPKCEFKVFVAEERIKGKFFIFGFEVHLKYKVYGSPYKFFSVRVHVKRAGGTFMYVLETRPSLVGGYTVGTSLSPMDTDLGGLNTFLYNAAYNRVHLVVGNCGLEIFFRAADESLGKNQMMLPGISIGVDESLVVEYKGLYDAFCLTSNKNELTVGDIANILDLKEDHAFIYRGLKGPSPDSFPGINGTKCNSLRSMVVSSCNNKAFRMKAFEECDFILDDPHFVNCYSDYPDSRDLIMLFEVCLQAYCEKDGALCMDAKSMVMASGCMALASDEFQGFDCVFSAGGP